ncbi:MAG TPA: orotidine-5'-phosphate decarboxylase, partial [Pirellulaceae bacterium]|nr:orotidine-5'-phosphate decarboxylase [Pirellulaceae bacterium]
LVPAIKPQVGFFEQWGPAGMEALRRVVDYAQSRQVLVILDAKRNDIGSTAVAYARAWLGSGDQSAFGGDAVTINPWLGVDSLTPFVERCAETRTGAFVLVKTSNPGSRDFQNLSGDNSRLYERVADVVEGLACASLGAYGYGDIGAVVGATYPEELSLLRQRMPHAMFLIPGYGAQGGVARDLAHAFNPQGLGAIVNSSRGVLFAFRKEGEKSSNGAWQFEVEQAARRAIADLVSETPAGNLEPN